MEIHASLMRIAYHVHPVCPPPCVAHGLRISAPLVCLAPFRIRSTFMLDIRRHLIIWLHSSATNISKIYPK